MLPRDNQVVGDEEEEYADDDDEGQVGHGASGAHAPFERMPQPIFNQFPHFVHVGPLL